MSQQGRILGIGGIFFKSENQQQMKEWYGKHLGLTDSGHGVMLPWREKDNPDSEQMTLWSIFPSNTKYFEPSSASFMMNYIVDDLDAWLARLAKEGVRIDSKRQDESYGRPSTCLPESSALICEAKRQIFPLATCGGRVNGCYNFCLSFR